MFLAVSLFVSRVKSTNLQSPFMRASVITIPLSVAITFLYFCFWFGLYSLGVYPMSVLIYS